MTEKLFFTLPEDIRQSLENGRFPHAAVIEGGSLEQRRSAALACAAAVVCRTGKDRPCGVCPSCKKALAGNHPDIIVLTGGEKPNSFGVDIIRQLKSTAYISPNESDKKVYILENAGSMSEQAQNALLKILEEPPEHSSLILECRSKSVLLGTVISRVQVFSLGENSDPAASEEKLKKAGEAANAFAASLCEAGEINTMKACAVFEKDRELLRLALPQIENILRDALTLRYTKTPASDYPETAADISEKLSEKKILKILEMIPGFVADVNRSANQNLLITRLCYKTRHA